MQKIDKNSFIPFLLEALPERLDAWNDFKDEWKEEKEGLPHYVFLSEIAGFVARKKETANLENLFEKIELILTEGDRYSQEACTVGLLEDMQNNLLKRKKPLSLYSAYMKPKTEKMWQRVNEFWGEGKLIKDE